MAGLPYIFSKTSIHVLTPYVLINIPYICPPTKTKRSFLCIGTAREELCFTNILNDILIRIPHTELYNVLFKAMYPQIILSLRWRSDHAIHAQWIYNRKSYRLSQPRFWAPLTTKNAGDISKSSPNKCVVYAIGMLRQFSNDVTMRPHQQKDNGLAVPNFII